MPSCGRQQRVQRSGRLHARRSARPFPQIAPSVAKKPFIYLSAGVSNAQFIESLNMAAEAARIIPACSAAARPGKKASRFIAKQGMQALEDWLSTEGVKNINAVNAAIESAVSFEKKS